MRIVFIAVLLTLAVVAASRAEEPTLNVSVMGVTSPEPVKFTGSYVYVTGGKEVKEDISGEGNRSEAFHGQYIKSCTVQKTSDKGTIRLVIYEDGKKTYDSKTVATKDPIVYERK